jgi:hypothetical protein
MKGGNMKQLSLTTIAIGTLVSILTIGCAKETSRSLSAAGTTNLSSCQLCIDTNGDGIGDTPITTGTATSSGSSVTLTASASQLRQMFINSMPSNPTNIQISLDLTSTSEAVIIRYTQNGIVHEAAFGGKHPYNTRVAGSMQSGWSTVNNQPVWKGFFQDRYGAIVVVIDSTINTGDGSPADFIGGRVYFQNFDQSPPNAPFQGSEAMCWEITTGPYDCRTFLAGNAIDFNSSLYPNNAGPIPTRYGHYYQELGRFTGLSRSAAGLPTP